VKSTLFNLFISLLIAPNFLGLQNPPKIFFFYLKSHYPPLLI